MQAAHRLQQQHMLVSWWMHTCPRQVYFGQGLKICIHGSLIVTWFTVIHVKGKKTRILSASPSLSLPICKTGRMVTSILFRQGRKILEGFLKYCAYLKQYYVSGEQKDMERRMKRGSSSVAKWPTNLVVPASTFSSAMNLLGGLRKAPLSRAQSSLSNVGITILAFLTGIA